jgi:EmrB/QacA subfamily drug resistance transporter
LSQKRLNIILVAIVLSIFLASMEGTVVATAMPSIVTQLGGLSIYSWVFSIYMLTSTSMVPIFGKLSDLFSRKWVFITAMALFLVGSVLCGQARGMIQLIIFRAIQGLGAGGVLPMAFIIIGDLFTLEQRARLQGAISGVWGVSSVVGPLIGGFLVDSVSWSWVFYINLIPGAAAISLILLAWREEPREKEKKVEIDYLGALFLTLAALGLLLGLNQLGTPLGWWFLAGAVVLSVALIWAERRAADPILPLHLFRYRLFIVSISQGFLSGWAMFGTLNFVPLFVQAVLGTNATQAGISLTPMSLFWTLASIAAGRLLLKVSYRTMAVVGMLLLSAGGLFMSRIGIHTSQVEIMIYTALMGMGMGLSIPALLVSVQTAVSKKHLGIATSTIQYSRSIGGTLGVSVMGAAFSAGLARRLISAGLDPAAISINSLLDPLSQSSTSFGETLQQALGGSMAGMFFIAFAAAAAGLLVVLFTPSGTIKQIENKATEESWEH